MSGVSFNASSTSSCCFSARASALSWLSLIEESPVEEPVSSSTIEFLEDDTGADFEPRLYNVTLLSNAEAVLLSVRKRYADKNPAAKTSVMPKFYQ